MLEPIYLRPVTPAGRYPHHPGDIMTACRIITEKLGQDYSTEKLRTLRNAKDTF
jgi:hypothetical protein